MFFILGDLWEVVVGKDGCRGRVEVVRWTSRGIVDEIREMKKEMSRDKYVRD